MTERYLYADSSALVKLVVPEKGSTELLGLLSDRALVASAIARVELPRVIRRTPPTDSRDRLLRAVLGHLHFVEMTKSVLALAASLEPPQLGSLDAIHLASALRIRRDVDSFVTYDRQLGRAARDQGLPIASPGL